MVSVWHRSCPPTPGPDQTGGIDTAAELYALEPAADVSGGPLQIVSITDDRIETVANPGYPDQGIPDVVYSVFADEADCESRP